MRRRWHRELIDEMREENRARREEHERWLVEWRARVEADAREEKRRFDALDAAMENDKRVTREVLLRMEEARERENEWRREWRRESREWRRESRAAHRDLHDESRAITEGLLRVIDRLDRNDGPSAAGA